MIALLANDTNDIRLRLRLVEAELTVAATGDAHNVCVRFKNVGRA